MALHLQISLVLVQITAVWAAIPVLLCLLTCLLMLSLMTELSFATMGQLVTNYSALYLIQAQAEILLIPTVDYGPC